MKILLADDHDLVRDTVAAFLSAEGIDTVKTAKNLEDALEIAQGQDVFDLVLLDYNMPGMNGLAGLERMKRAVAGVPVAILSGQATPAVASSAVEAGAAGFLPKTLGAKSIVGAIRIMAAGEVFVPFNFMQSGEQESVADLSKRETEVLRGLTEGKSNKEIARDLDLQEVTIKLHVKTLCRKLDARNRTHAAMIAKERDLF